MLQGRAAWVLSRKVVQQMWWPSQRSQKTHSWCPNRLVSGAGRRVVGAQDHDGQWRLLTSEVGSLGRSTSSWFGPCWSPQMDAPLSDRWRTSVNKLSAGGCLYFVKSSLFLTIAWLCFPLIFETITPRVWVLTLFGGRSSSSFIFSWSRDAEDTKKMFMWQHCPLLEEKVFTRFQHLLKFVLQLLKKNTVNNKLGLYSLKMTT